MKTLNGNLESEINECYLFHGTKSDIVDAIEQSGFDFRVSSDNAMFGRGVYFAESSTKADQYVGMSEVCFAIKKKQMVFIISKTNIGDVLNC